MASKFRISSRKERIMILKNFSIVGFLFFALNGCVSIRNSSNSKEQQQVIDKINVALRQIDSNHEFEYSISSNEECIATVSVKWPSWRLDDSSYTVAVTSYRYDWRAIGLVSYKNSQEQRPPNYNKSEHIYISIDFVSPQRYRTEAMTIEEEKYDEISFDDGLELYIAPANSAHIQDVINGILKIKNDCITSRGRLELQDLKSYSPEEQYQIGNAYLYSRHPTSKPLLAYEIYAIAAQRGNLGAQLQMGNALRSGLNGVPKDLMAARRMFEAAGAQGSPIALDMLGDFYEKGVGGVNADPVKAMEYYRRAANQGVMTAQESLAEMLYFGKGVPKDIIEARAWYSKAAKSGSKSASDALRMIEKKQ